jgi:hypothetical protein
VTGDVRRGMHVRYVGIGGRADGPTGRVVSVSTAGVRVRWDDGRTELVHPDDVKVVSS